MFRVAVPVRARGEFITLMQEMRDWLDQRRAEATFECTFAAGKTACYLEFRDANDAAGFAAEFAGRFEARITDGQVAA
jgi:hypothetical protein